jgi:hypothetical protein
MKYSEKSFDIKTIVSLFDHYNKKNQVAPSYLLLSPDENYLKKAALEISVNILSLNEQKQRAENKKKILSHPDLIILELEGKNKSISIDEVREATSRINLKPYKAKKKVLIINQAYKMTEQAQNAFLKTLEEPPKDTVIFLLSKEVIGLLDTLKSRCKIIRISNFDVSQNGFFLENEIQFVNNFIKIKNNRYIDYFNFSNKEEYRKSLVALYIMLRDIVLIKNGVADDKILFIAQNKEISSFAKRIDENKCCELIEVFYEAYRYIMSNVNLRLSQINVARMVSKIMES